MRVLVTGGRDYRERDRVNTVLGWLHEANPITLIIHGNSFGADLWARQWARANGIPDLPFQALWDEQGHAAGPIRNAKMIAESKADLVVAFPGGRGTADCTAQAEAADLFVHEVKP